MSTQQINISAISEQIATLHKSVVVIQRNITKCASSMDECDRTFNIKIDTLGSMIDIIISNFNDLSQFTESQTDDADAVRAKVMLNAIQVCIDAIVKRHKGLIRYRKDCIDLAIAKSEINMLYEEARVVDAAIAKQRSGGSRRQCVIL